MGWTPNLAGRAERPPALTVSICAGIFRSKAAEGFAAFNVVLVEFEFEFLKVACGVDHMLALSSNGQLYGWGRNAYNEILQAPIYASSGTALDLDGKL